MIADGFDRSAARGFLDTATVGLPPQAALRALAGHTEQWGAGSLNPRDVDREVARARRAFARIVAADPAHVAIGASASPFVGLVAASLPDRSEVLAVEGEFTSVLFPFLSRGAGGPAVRTVELDDLIDSISSRTRLVAVSAVQSADGRMVDLQALAAAADHHGAEVLLDVTQAAGWLPIEASRFSYVLAAAYKWLLCPRGTAFMAVSPEAAERLTPLYANWYAGAEPWESIYGLPLRLAPDARRFDSSPAWPCWFAAAPALEQLADLGPSTIGAHNARLADSMRARLSLEPTGSAIVSLSRPGAAELLKTAGVRGAIRAGGARLSFHLYNDEEDVDLAAGALGV